MFTTDTHFQERIRFSPVLKRHTYQLSYTITIKCLEWIKGEDFHPLSSSWLFQPINVFQQELALGIVTADAKSCLSQVICAKAEELGNSRDLVGSQSGSWKFDHRAEFILNSRTNLRCDLLCHGLKLSTNFLQLIDMADQWDHDLWMDLFPLSGKFYRRLQNCSGLHHINLWENQS